MWPSIKKELDCWNPSVTKTANTALVGLQKKERPASEKVAGLSFMFSPKLPYRGFLGLVTFLAAYR